MVRLERGIGLDLDRELIGVYDWNILRAWV